MDSSLCCNITQEHLNGELLVSVQELHVCRRPPALTYRLTVGGGEELPVLEARLSPAVSRQTGIPFNGIVASAFFLLVISVHPQRHVACIRREE